MVYQLQMCTKNKIEYPTEEMLKDISKFSENLTLWGSNNVIKKWLKFRNISKTNVQGIDTLFVLEEII